MDSSHDPRPTTHNPRPLGREGMARRKKCTSIRLITETSRSTTSLPRPPRRAASRGRCSTESSAPAPFTRTGLRASGPPGLRASVPMPWSREPAAAGGDVSGALAELSKPSSTPPHGHATHFWTQLGAALKRDSRHVSQASHFRVVLFSLKQTDNPSESLSGKRSSSKGKPDMVGGLERLVQSRATDHRVGRVTRSRSRTQEQDPGPGPRTRTQDQDQEQDSGAGPGPRSRTRSRT
ncbi:hypothetical protein EYF80_039369 [Liparis tanakae]|uniref:Uncharacterized protein n=1 Tax=Liparis tanakae TaxID=230148 RepID=A0A4Z2GBZ0_9TELE|nr:hypothetical protein EYF80_039369 [Liparis tanakae]